METQTEITGWFATGDFHPKKMSKAFFVTGTDTGIGKTHIACALLQAFAAQGQRVVGMKPVAAGCDDNGLYDDVQKLQAASNVQADIAHINPYRFAPAIAPHIAAQQERMEISFAPIIAAFKALQQQADVVIVEGAGGIAVPLNSKQDMADLALALDIPVILVVGMRLGCLNHALLSAQAIERKGLHLAGWVANYVTSDMPVAAENEKTLLHLLKAPFLGAVPYSTALPVAASGYLELAKIT
jgi:dethiobiotin synthetase